MPSRPDALFLMIRTLRHTIGPRRTTRISTDFTQPLVGRTARRRSVTFIFVVIQSEVAHATREKGPCSQDRLEDYVNINQAHASTFLARYWIDYRRHECSFAF